MSHGFIVTKEHRRFTEFANAVRKALRNVRALHELDWTTQCVTGGDAQQHPTITVLERQRRHCKIERCDQWGFPFWLTDC